MPSKDHSNSSEHAPSDYSRLAHEIDAQTARGFDKLRNAVWVEAPEIILSEDGLTTPTQVTPQVAGNVIELAARSQRSENTAEQNLIDALRLNVEQARYDQPAA